MADAQKAGVNMPTYRFVCNKCDVNFDIVESIKTYDGDGECPTCKNISRERVYSSKVQFIGTSVQSPEYNPAFGQVVKNKQHRDELAKRNGLIEIGNEKPETVHKHYESERADKLKKAWDDV